MAARIEAPENQEREKLENLPYWALGRELGVVTEKSLRFG